MKKVLIPAYEFYPKNSGGTFRQVKFAKYLQDHGWAPVVVAPGWSANNTFDYDLSMEGKDPCRVERISLKPASRGRDLCRRILYKFAFSPRYTEWNLAYRTLDVCRRICTEESVDAIFASSLPPYVHWVANRLNEEFGIPWVADFRDIADQEQINESNPVMWFAKRMRRMQLLRTDVRYASSASRIVTVSEGLKERLTTRFSAPIDVIMNGFDPTDFEPSLCKGVNTQEKRKMRIVYTGSLFGNRDPRVFFEGVNLLFRNYPALKGCMEISFFGRSSEEVKKHLPYLMDCDAVNLCGMISHPESVAQITSADVLYLISHKSKGIVTGKIFEYLASGRPILSVPGDGDITDQIISETKAGVVASTAEQVAEALVKWIEEWQINGCIASTTDKKALMKYTRQSQSQQLATILECVVSTAGGPL